MPNESPELSTQFRHKNSKIWFFRFWRFFWPTCLDQLCWYQWFLDAWGNADFVKNQENLESGSDMFRRRQKPIVRGSCTVNVTTRSLEYGLPTPSKYVQTRIRNFWKNGKKNGKHQVMYQHNRLRHVGQKSGKSEKSHFRVFGSKLCRKFRGFIWDRSGVDPRFIRGVWAIFVNLVFFNPVVFLVFWKT